MSKHNRLRTLEQNIHWLFSVSIFFFSRSGNQWLQNSLCRLCHFVIADNPRYFKVSCTNILLNEKASRTCEVEAGWRQRHGVVQLIERGSILKPYYLDWFRRPVSNALQTQAHIRHYRHVVGFNREMWET